MDDSCCPACYHYHSDHRPNCFGTVLESEAELPMFMTITLLTSHYSRMNIVSVNSNSSHSNFAPPVNRDNLSTSASVPPLHGEPVNLILCLTAITSATSGVILKGTSLTTLGSLTGGHLHLY